MKAGKKIAYLSLEWQTMRRHGTTCAAAAPDYAGLAVQPAA
jgi:hypothetical protein